MLIAYNNDIEFRSRWYHIQTEDNGIKDGHIMTTVFYSGQILDSNSISYKSAIEGVTSVEEQNKIIKNLMVKQHQLYYTKLYEGTYEAIVTGQSGRGANANTTSSRPAMPSRVSQTIADESGLDFPDESPILSRMSKPDILRASQQLPSVSKTMGLKSLTGLTPIKSPPNRTPSLQMPKNTPRLASLTRPLAYSNAVEASLKRPQGLAYTGMDWPEDDLAIDLLVVAILEEQPL